MKSVLISIRPEWCEKIASGEKTVEVRKTRPEIEPPFKCYIYCTKGKEKLWVLRGSERAFTREKIAAICQAKDVGGAYQGNGKVIGEFVCDNVAKILNFLTHFGVEGRPESELNTIARASCLDYMDMLGYFGTEKDGYSWHISDLVIYEFPMELGMFAKPDKCPYNLNSECAYPRHCYRAGQTKRCGDYLERPPQSWCCVEGGE